MIKKASQTYCVKGQELLKMAVLWVSSSPLSEPRFYNLPQYFSRIFAKFSKLERSKQPVQLGSAAFILYSCYYLTTKHNMNLSETKQILTISQITPGSRFVISIAYFFKVSPSAPPWSLLPDSPIAIDHSTRWIAYTTELSSLKHSFSNMSGPKGHISWFQSPAPPWRLLPDSHSDIDHSTS